MPEKVCIICGEDCSSKPRTKDSRGRYYCTSCFESARERKKDGVDKPPVAEDDSVGLKPPDDQGESEWDHLFLESSAGASCAGCGGLLAPGSVICVNCGFDVRTGTSLQVETDQARKKWVPSSLPVSWLLQPRSAAVAALGVYGLLAYAALQSRTDTAVALLLVWHGLYLLSATVAILLAAFRRSIGQGLLTLLVPFYVLYFVFSVDKSPLVRWLFAVGVAGVAITKIVDVTVQNAAWGTW